jgi:hypothetical protein
MNWATDAAAAAAAAAAVLRDATLSTQHDEKTT